MGSLVAVDGGRSRCRAAVIGADGRPCPVAEGPGLPPGAGPAAVEAIVVVGAPAGSGPGDDAGWVVDNAVACVDGWGHLLGDVGSGFWIGRRGLDAALRAHDGRGGGSPLLARLVERDVGPLDRLPELAARAGAGPVAAIASFSVQVAEAARAGDEVARYIWLEAAGALADSAVACARRLHPGSQIPISVSWVGGLFSAPDALLLDPFLARVPSTFPAV